MSKGWIKHVLVGIFVLATIADIVTAVLLGIDMRESNPLFIFLKSWWILVVLKILLVLVVVFVLAYPKQFRSERVYYLVILLLMFGTLLQGAGAYSNIRVGYIEQETYQNIPVPSTAEKVEFYSFMVLLFYALPFIIAFLPYLIFEWTAPYQKFKKKRLVVKDEQET